jgi:hypothetical protein
VEEVRQRQAQELIDSQHTSELEEMDELLTPATRPKGLMVPEDEEEPATEEEPVKEEESVSNILRLGSCMADSDHAQHTSKSQEDDTEADAPDNDDEEIDQLADDDDDDDYKQVEELKSLSAVVPPMRTIKAVRERKVVAEDGSDDYGRRRRSGRGVKRRRPSTPQVINETDLRRSGRAKRQKTDDMPNMLAFVYGESNQEEVIVKELDAPPPPPTVSEAGSTTITEQLAATSLDIPPPQQEPTIPAPEDGPSTPTVALDMKKGKGGRKSNARFWVYAEVDEDALPKDLPDPDALMRRQRKSLTGEKKPKRQAEAEVNDGALPETNGQSKPVSKRGRGRGWRGGRGGARGEKQNPTEVDEDEISGAAQGSTLETS